MDKGKMTVFAVMAAVLLTAAIFTVFITTSTAGNDAPPIALPPAPSGGNPDQGGSISDPGDARDPETLIEITTQNVAAVIEDLKRPDNWTADMTVEHFWTGGQSSVLRKVWVSDGIVRWQSFDEKRQPIENSIAVNGSVFIWDEGSTSYIRYTQGDISLDDLGQIPTYEEILTADEKDILSAVYEDVQSEACIKTEIRDPESGILRTYWVSLEKGILWAAVYYEGDQVIYRMTVSQAGFSSHGIDPEIFKLPDGKNPR